MICLLFPFFSVLAEWVRGRGRGGWGLTSLRTVSTFLCFWGTVRGLARLAVRCARTSWLERMADWDSRIFMGAGYGVGGGGGGEGEGEKNSSRCGKF